MNSAHIMAKHSCGQGPFHPLCDFERRSAKSILTLLQISRRVCLSVTHTICDGRTVQTEDGTRDMVRGCRSQQSAYPPLRLRPLPRGERSSRACCGALVDSMQRPETRRRSQHSNADPPAVATPPCGPRRAAVMRAKQWKKKSQYRTGRPAEKESVTKSEASSYRGQSGRG